MVLSYETYVIFIGAMGVYFVISLYAITQKGYDLDFLNPIRNYKEWEKFNWFGVAMLTVLLNVICLPYAVFYWVFKLIYWLFTVGR